MTDLSGSIVPPKASPLMFRGPSTAPSKPDTTFTPPPPGFLRGTWRVIYSTLPMWKANRNVTITYTMLDDPPEAIDDLVRYQPLDSDKQKEVHGIDTPDDQIQAKYTWRGRGWLKIASSQWEVLGFGEEEAQRTWVVTYFAKTLFTPAGIDVYSRTKDGISDALLDRIKAEMRSVDDQDFCDMAGEIFKVHHD